ncbi:MAG: hypothetical protein ACRD41_11535, partial [Candidatus Acidiferrales bacterium]
PKLRGTARPASAGAWICWGMWTLGVTTRWFANVYAWHWRALLPISGVLEIAAFWIFFRTVSRHRPEDSGKTAMEPWVWVVITACAGLMLVLLANLAATFYLAFRGTSPALPHAADQRYLVLVAWGFLVPFVWGFSSKWMPVFLGLKPVRFSLLFPALGINFAGILMTLAGWGGEATALFIVGTILAIAGLRMFEPAQQEAKTRGVNASFPFFVRMAYAWLLVAALLGGSAAIWDHSGGIWGASRHALTVGFIAVMVLCVGQRVLPAFAGMRLLWSTRLMFAGLALLSLGCVLRVAGEVLAYQEIAPWAWSVLPVSAFLELAGISAFAVNIFGTFLLEPSRVQKPPAVVSIVK